MESSERHDGGGTAGIEKFLERGEVMVMRKEACFGFGSGSGSSSGGGGSGGKYRHPLAVVTAAASPFF
jgi:hypothetical protein